MPTVPSVATVPGVRTVPTVPTVDPTMTRSSTGPSTRPSVYEAAGGADALLRLAAAHHQRCLADPELEHPFSHGLHPDHVEHLAWYWAEVLGGPPRYSTEVAGESRLLAMHAGNDMADDLGPRFVACFVGAMDDAALPDDPELRACLRRYMVWAVDEMMRYDPPGATVPDGLRMPRWSWDGPEAVSAPTL